MKRLACEVIGAILDEWPDWLFVAGLIGLILFGLLSRYYGVVP